MAFNVVAIAACVIGAVVKTDVVAAVVGTAIVGIVVEKACDDAMVTDADVDADTDAEEPLVPIDPRAVEAPRA